MTFGQMIKDLAELHGPNWADAIAGIHEGLALALRHPEWAASYWQQLPAEMRDVANNAADFAVMAWPEEREQ